MTSLRCFFLSTCMLVSSSVWAQPGESPGEGLVSYWSFDGSTVDVGGLTTSDGGTVDDNLVPQGGAARYVPGVVGEALAFGDRVGDAAWLNAPTSDDVVLGPVYSIEAWVHPTLLDETWQRLVLRWQGVLSYHFALRLVGADWTVSLFHQQSDGVNINADGGNVPVGEWSHIAAVADGGFLVCYLNGVEVARTAYDGTINEAPGAGLGLGDMAGGNGLRYNGYVDELAIWALALDEEEILSHFEAGPEGYGIVLTCEEDLDSLTVEGPTIGSVDAAVEVTATLDGVDDGQVASYSWEIVSGDASLDGETTATVSVTPGSFGAIELLVRASDGLCANESTATHTIAAFGGVGESPETGLVSYWSFDGATVDLAPAVDQGSGESSDDLLPLGGVERFDEGISGQALALGVEAGDATSFIGANTADVELPGTYSIECWVFPTELSSDWQRLVLRWGDGLAYHFSIRNNGGFINSVSLFHQQSDGTQLNTNGGTVVLNRWQHIACVADGEFLRVYLDGAEVDSVPYDGTITTGIPEGLGIGDSNTSLSGIKYNGLLDELAIWDVALDPEHIESHFLAGPGGYGLTIGCPEEIDTVSIDGPAAASVGQAIELEAMLGGVDDEPNLEILWEVIEGDAEIESVTLPLLTVVPTAAGTLTLRVSVDDGLCGNVVSAEHSIVVFEPEEGESPDDGLVAYWSFDDGIDDVASDFDNNVGVVADDLLALGGDVNLAFGIRGQALSLGRFAGDAVSLQALDSDDIVLPAEYTIECWILPTELAASWQRLVLRWGTGFSYHFSIRNNGGFVNAVSLFHNQADGAMPNANGGTVVINEWQHIAGVADGEFLRVYLNGVEVDAVPYDGTIDPADGAGLGIADQFEGTSNIKFNGLIDELALWSVALDPEHIESHYLAGPNGYGLESCPEDRDSLSLDGPELLYTDEGVQMTATFDGADEGSTVSYDWSVTEGSARIVDNDDGTATVTCTGAGNVTVSVSADDGICPESGGVEAELELCCEARDVVSIDVSDFGGIGVEMSLIAQFDGNDAGEAATYEWELLQGVATFVPDGSLLLLTCEEADPVLVRVTVADGACEDSASAEIEIFCENVDFSFRRGDSNDDGRIDLSDGVFTLNHLFTGGPTPACREAANTNADANVDISDASFTFAFLFLGGPPPPTPGPVGECNEVVAAFADCDRFVSCP